MPRDFSPKTSLDSLKREAKRWLKALREGVAEARARLERSLPDVGAAPTLRDVQHALALEHGLPGWGALKERLAQTAALRRYERVADALVIAYHTPDPAAMRVVWEFFGHMRTWDAMRRYIRLDLGKSEQPPDGAEDRITLDEARFLVARAQGFASWSELIEYAESGAANRPTSALKGVALYTSTGRNSGAPFSITRDWQDAIAVMRAEKLTGLAAHGQMTDALLDTISRIEQITDLDLSGSGQVTDVGLRYLARLPQLTRLNLSGCAITDRGLQLLPQLPQLRWIELGGTRITDAGAAHLAGCAALERVDLSGTACGDGAIRALAGKRVTHLRTGNTVTDAGFALLHDLPIFKQWQGGDTHLELFSFDDGPNFLMLRGPFTDAGMAQLVGLDGLFGLNVDDARLQITATALGPLAALPHLEFLSFDARDDSMPYLAALPHLRFLMCQDTSASDAGWVALGASRTIEYIWGRRCYGLRRNGFLALSQMPALCSLSVSCRNVDDAGLAAFPHFPALRELMPMDVPDDGYRHIAKCEKIDTLTLMYCRETTDRATEHIAGMTLKKYFASYNRITDRTPEILSRMDSLEEVTFDSCAGLTNSGIAHLARLPNLRAVSVGGMRNVTADIAQAFPAQVRVSHSL